MWTSTLNLLDALDRLCARRGVRALLLLVALVAVYLQAHYFLLAESHEVDSYAYWFAARAVARGEDPYDLGVLESLSHGIELRLVAGDVRRPHIYPYVYPPPFAGLWRAVTFLSPTGVHRLLEVVNTLLLGVALVLLHRLVRPARHAQLAFALLALGLAVNGPAVSSTRLGQVNAALLVLMLLATEGYRRGADLRSALALAAAVLLKVTPAFLALGWGLAGPGSRWRGYVVRVTLLVVGFALLALPLAPWVQWRHFAAALERGIPWQSPNSWWGWLTIQARSAPWLLEYRRLLYLAGVVLLGAVALVHVRRAARQDLAVEGAAAGVVLGLLLSPLTWHHHFLFFVLPAYVWVTRAWSERRTVLAAALGFLSVLVLLRLPGAWIGVRPPATLAAFVLVAFAPRGGAGREPDSPRTSGSGAVEVPE